MAGDAYGGRTTQARRGCAAETDGETGKKKEEQKNMRIKEEKKREKKKKKSSMQYPFQTLHTVLLSPQYKRPLPCRSFIFGSVYTYHRFILPFYIYIFFFVLFLLYIVFLPPTSTCRKPSPSRRLTKTSSDATSPTWPRAAAKTANMSRRGSALGAATSGTAETRAPRSRRCSSRRTARCCCLLASVPLSSTLTARI